MKKTSPLLLALAAILSVSCQLEAPPSTEETGQQSAVELGARIAGTWLGVFEVDAPGFPETPFITTYHSDGTATTTSSRTFGAGDPDRNGLSGTQHVQWEVAGPRKIRWRLLHFGHAADGNLISVSRTHGVTEFDESFEQSRGRFQAEIFAPETLLTPLDPNAAAATPTSTASGTDRARRLHVENAPGEGASAH